METPPPPPPPPCRVLPKKTHITQTQIRFLNLNLGGGSLELEELLDRAPLLITQLSNQCSALEGDLQKRLTKLVVSWISRSFGAKLSLSNLKPRIHSLITLSTSSCEIDSSRWKGKDVMAELPRIVNHVLRIDTIRNYIDTALKLEALVGDLEDVVFCFGAPQMVKMSSAKGLTSQLSMDLGKKLERFSHATEVINAIEEVLGDALSFQPHWQRLLDSVDTRVDKALAVVRPQLLADHRALLAILGWPPKLLASKVDNGEITDPPNPLGLMEGDKRKFYSQSFLALCTLQHLQTRRECRQHKSLEDKQPGVTLWAIEELVSPIASQMECHFSKWKDQPEFIFALAYKITSNFVVGIDHVLQPLIDKARLASYSAREAWVFAMVQMLSGFLAKEVFPALANGYKEKQTKSETILSWLYLIDCMVGFDKWMKSLATSETHFLLLEYERSQGIHRGLSVLEIFCDRPDWFKIWTKIELKEAWKKLKPELKDEKAWSVHDNSVAGLHISIENVLSNREHDKAPVIADSAVKIAWELVERCQTLPSILLRSRFVRSTAARFLWYFLNVLVLRSKNTQFALDNTDDALVKISGSINAARYIDSKLREWSDDMDFVEMRIAEKKLDSGINGDDLNESCFFLEEIGGLVDLETNLLMEIIAVLLQNFEAISWSYSRDGGYFNQVLRDFTSNGAPATIDGAVSVDFCKALDVMSRQLELLKMTLNPKDFIDLWRSFAEGLDHFLSSSIFAGDIQFSEAGIHQFRVDMQALFFLFKSFCARPAAFFPCISEILNLLKMSKEQVKRLQMALSTDKSRTRCLHLFGISHLSLVHVDKVLRNRKFDP